MASLGILTFAPAALAVDRASDREI